MNPTVSTIEAVDTAFYVIFGISGVALLGILAAMLWFVWRYNRRRQPVPLSQKDHNLWLEVIWTIIPTGLVLVMFWYGWEGYLSLRRIPDDALEIRATARMWSWQFSYAEGKSADKLYVPVGRPIKVRLESTDVLHSFYVPAFRVKRDMVPGMTTWVWFRADQPGSYDLFCAEYCGVGHAAMITTVEALPAADYAAWLEDQPAADGAALLQQYGCLGCHSLDGSTKVGPTFQGIAGRPVTVTRAGQSVTLTSDRAYLEEAILDPNASLVAGYPPAMPSYAEQIPAEELAVMLDYLEGLRDEGGERQVEAKVEVEVEEKPKPKPEPKVQPKVEPEAKTESEPEPQEDAAVARGAALAQQLGCLGCHSLDGSRVLGPSLKGLAGSQRPVLRDGAELTLTADRAYLERAIRAPTAELSVGYPPAMPPYPQLSDAELADLIRWLESLR